MKKTVHIPALLPGRWLLLLMLFVVLVYSCKKEEGEDQPTQTDQYLSVKKKIFSVMQYWYLWNHDLPTVNSANYSTPDAFLDALRYKKDRYSFIMDRTEFLNYFNEGTYYGHGISIGADVEGNLRIVFIYNDSPLKAAGVSRGWIIKSINGTLIQPGVDVTALLGKNEAGVENTFVFIDLQGQEHTVTSAKKAVAINSVLYKGVLQAGTKKTGYLVFETFITPSVAELDSAFNFFLSENIDEMIVDLRYNGGGEMNVAVHLSGLLASSAAAGKVLVKMEHNTDRSSYDTILTVPNNVQSPALSRLFYIAGRGTASASEVLMNGLSPWIPTITAGDSTYGKPVGMYAFDFKPDPYFFVPICFKLTNANGFGDYFDGLPADYYVGDDLTHDFGDPEEAELKAVLTYISEGHWPVTKAARKPVTGFGFNKLKGIRADYRIF
ncbi:MAG TPA: S41 family peptidase [Bacteroidales bacterium]|nr:S41 family peptidase [Bacteroidales bacterium]